MGHTLTLPDGSACRRAAYAEMQAAAARNKAHWQQQENRLAGVLAGGPSAAYQHPPSHQAGASVSIHHTIALHASCKIIGSIPQRAPD